MRLSVSVVIPEHPAVVVRSHEVIDKRKIVSTHLAGLIDPDLLADQSRSAHARHQRFVINCLPQPSLRRHSTRLLQIGPQMPYLQGCQASQRGPHELPSWGGQTIPERRRRSLHHLQLLFPPRTLPSTESQQPKINSTQEPSKTKAKSPVKPQTHPTPSIQTT